MSSFRVSKSIKILSYQSLVGHGSGKDTVTGVIAAACMMAVSPITLAVAQESSDSTPLPAIKVEAKTGKKKAAAKKSAPKPPQAAAPTPQAAPQPTPAAAGANPYANPNAPYMVERSASGKLTQPLVDTPKTVTAVPKEVIEDKGARDLRDLARDVPGLTIGSAEGGNAFGAFAIRGFKANNDIFVDSIRNPGNLIPDVFSVEQIEIYKGPSGGIAGRSTIGGAVNLISKQPVLDDNFYEVSTTIGTDDTFRTTIDANQVVTPDFAVRANLMYDQHDIAGRDITDSERWGGLISATAKPTDGLTVTLDYYRYRNDATPDWGVPVRNVDNVPVTELGFPRDLWVGMKGLDFFKEEADIGTATVVAKLADGVTLTNRSRIGESSVDYVATSMEGYPDVHHPNRDQTANIYANQTELNVKFDTGGLKHDMVAGIEVSREEIARSGYSVSNLYDTTRPFPSNPYSPTDTILSKGKVYDATIDTIGTYLSDTVHLSEQWIVNGGFRFDDFERDQVGGRGAAGTTDPAANTAKVQEDLFSWNVGVVYKPIPIASLYAAYGTSESPIGSELDSTGAQYNGISPTLVNVPPQEARAVEIGTKWELFDRRLLATAALFQTDVDHARTNDGVTAANDANAYAGEYRVRGIELSVAGNITDDWSVFGGLVLLDTEVLKSSNAQDVGRRLANIPLTQFALMSKYQLTDKLSVAGSATYGGEVYGGHLAANAANNHTVDWWRFDAFAEYQLTDQIEIEVSGLNLTDELYYDAIYQAADTFAFVAPGRAGYLTVKWKY
jgi:catecholate siderophore receptor